MQNRPSATMRLIELAEHLTPSGEIGDGLVNQFHEAAALARLEQGVWPAKACGARQYSDQMLCECGLAWDTNDPEPPACPRLAA